MIKYLLISLLLVTGTFVSAQYDMGNNEDTTTRESKFDRQNILSRTYVGGEFGLQFGGLTRIYVAPIIGFDIIKPLSFGVSTMYQLFRQRFTNGAVINQHSIGGGIFTRFRPIPQMVIQAEFNAINTVDINNAFGDRINIPVVMAGLGYAGDFGGRAYYQALLMYDFVDHPSMPLPQLIPGIPLYLKIGINFYLGERQF